MYKLIKLLSQSLLGISLVFIGCKIPVINQPTKKMVFPSSFGTNQDTTQWKSQQWKNYFTDSHLIDLIDTALKNNQELLITLQEIEIAKNEVRFRKGEILPTVGLHAGTGVEKVGKYTSQGAGDASAEITPGEIVPENLQDYNLSLYAHWEVDIWKKLHNAKKAAIARYLSTIEGKNFVLTNLIAEVANSYYELLALDNQLEIVRQTIELQKNALKIIKVQKEAGRESELAVQKFKAEVLNSQNLEFDLLQKIKETENQINFLCGRFPQSISRGNNNFLSVEPTKVNTGIPSQLLLNRPDIKQAELELKAAKLDVNVARAEFYPSFGINAGLGFQAFKPSYLLKFPESLLYTIAGDVAAPLINRNGIKAAFLSANARQLQALYNYEKTILNAYIEVSTQLSNIDNLKKKYALKSEEVHTLNNAIQTSNDLFKSSRADYLEVLMTQRDALEAKLELIETKKQQFIANTQVYRNLGGGWQ